MQNVPDAAARRPVVLSIAGFDPSAGAGVTADIKVFAAFQLYGMACLSATTVQSTRGVAAVEPLAPNTVAATLRLLREDVDFAGVKIGMLATAAICEEVFHFLDPLRGVPIVLDPVLRSSSGRELLEPAALPVLREKLLQRVSWITPNLHEVFVLTGLKVLQVEDVPAAAQKLQDLASDGGNERLNVVVTGGHLDRPDDYLLTAQGESHWLRGQRVETRATHGTGCAFSSALLCAVVQGKPPLEAAWMAKQYVSGALTAAYPVGRGKGPLNHFFRWEGQLRQ